MTGKDKTGGLSRRCFTLGVAAPAALGMMGMSARAARAAVRERSLHLDHMHTGETLKIVYQADGDYLPESLEAVSRHLRDWRTGETVPVDPELLDLIWNVRQRLETTRPVQVLCGYRSPETNEMLRRRQSGVAHNSLHLKGMAIDFRIPGHSLRALRNAARSLKGGGVGYYPRSGFVHMDTGQIRYW